MVCKDVQVTCGDDDDDDVSVYMNHTSTRSHVLSDDGLVPFTAVDLPNLCLSVFCQ